MIYNPGISHKDYPANNLMFSLATCANPLTKRLIPLVNPWGMSGISDPYRGVLTALRR